MVFMSEISCLPQTDVSHTVDFRAGNVNLYCIRYGIMQADSAESLSAVRAI
jgi:hypothetical protein